MSSWQGFTSPAFKISLNNTEISPAIESAILEIKVEDELNLPAMFTIRYSIVDFKASAWRGIDLDIFKPGDLVSISLGYAQLQELIVGQITALEPSFGEYCFMDIRGHDRLYLLNFGNYTRVFNNYSDSSIASTIASEVGLIPNVDEVPSICDYVYQNNQTNYSFLLSRCLLINYEMLVTDKEFYFRKSKEGQAPILSFEYELDITDLLLKLKILNLGSSIQVLSWDVANKQAVSAQISSTSQQAYMGGTETGFQLSTQGFSSTPMTINNEYISDAEAANIVAQAQYNTELNYFIEGEGSCAGNPSLRAGVNISITGIGNRFSGVYYITATTHHYSQTSGYITYFKLRRTGI